MTYFVSHASEDTPEPRQGRAPNPEKRGAFLFGLSAKPSRHCSRAMEREPCRTRARELGGWGTPQLEPNTQHAKPHSTTRERHGSHGLPVSCPHEPKTTQGRLPERRRAVQRRDIGAVVPKPRRDASQSVRGCSFGSFLGACFGRREWCRKSHFIT